jgi:hypothetical protein
VGLPTVAHQELQRGPTRLEGIVLPQVSEPQIGVTNYFVAIELFLAEKNAQQRTVARTPLPTTKPTWTSSLSVASARVDKTCRRSHSFALLSSERKSSKF